MSRLHLARPSERNAFRRFRRSRQAGLTLLEVIVSLTILSAASLGMVNLASRYSDDMVTSVSATQMRSFGDASKAYIKDNYSAVMAVATPTAPAMINVATLIAAGKLPPGFSAINTVGKTMCTLVVQPTANRLQAMVVGEGGVAMSDLSLGSLAATIGGSGGGVYSQASTVIRGAVGGWAVPTATFDNLTNNLGTNCAGAAGPVRVVTGTPVMALWFENGDTNAAFMARDAVPGRPELNAMNTPLVMNSVQTLNAACTVTGAIAQDGAGGILSCQGGTWKSSGDGKCVSTASDLNLLQTDGRCYNGVALPNSPAGGEWVFVEVSRHTNLAAYYVAQRVVGMTGAAVGRVWQRNQQSGTQAGGWSAWVQQADSQVSIGAGGAVTAAGTVTGGRVQSSAGSVGGAGQSYYDMAGSHIGASGSIYSYGSICSQNSAGDCSGGGGTVISGGYVTAANALTAGSLQSNSSTVTYGNTYNVADTWALLGYGAGWNGNASPQSAVGSAYLNDAYIRSTGKWVSQISSGGGLNSGAPGSFCSPYTYCNRSTGTMMCIGTVTDGSNLYQEGSVGVYGWWSSRYWGWYGGMANMWCSNGGIWMD